MVRPGRPRGCDGWGGASVAGSSLGDSVSPARSALWDIETGQQKTVFVGHTGDCMAWSGPLTSDCSSRGLRRQRQALGRAGGDLPADSHRPRADINAICVSPLASVSSGDHLPTPPPISLFISLPTAPAPFLLTFHFEILSTHRKAARITATVPVCPLHLWSLSPFCHIRFGSLSAEGGRRMDRHTHAHLDVAIDTLGY